MAANAPNIGLLIAPDIGALQSAGGAQSFTLTADSAAFSVTGTAADFKAALRLTADGAAFGVTANDVTFPVSLSLPADSAAFSVTAADARVGRDYTVTATGAALGVRARASTLLWIRVPITWVAIRPETVSWGTPAGGTGTWTGITRPVVPPAWAVLSSVQTTYDIGVDFRLVLAEQYPLRVSADRPIFVYDLYPEGTP